MSRSAARLRNPTSLWGTLTASCFVISPFFSNWAKTKLTPCPMVFYWLVWVTDLMLMWNSELAVASRHQLNEIECWRCAASPLPERTNVDSSCSGDVICSENVICLAPKYAESQALFFIASAFSCSDSRAKEKSNRASDFREKKTRGWTAGSGLKM